MSTCLASLTPARRKCVLRYLIDQIRVLEPTLRSEEVDMDAMTPDSKVGAALKEAH